MIDNDVRERFINGYVAALFFAWPEDETPEAELSLEAWATVRADCGKFISENEADLDEALSRVGYDAGRAGHDFWLTRCHHGAGYWDRDELENLDPEDVGESLGDRLTRAADAFGGQDPYVGDDGKVYIG